MKKYLLEVSVTEADESLEANSRLLTVTIDFESNASIPGCSEKRKALLIAIEDLTKMLE